MKIDEFLVLVKPEIDVDKLEVSFASLQLQNPVGVEQLTKSYPLRFAPAMLATVAILLSVFMVKPLFADEWQAPKLQLKETAFALQADASNSLLTHDSLIRIRFDTDSSDDTIMVTYGSSAGSGLMPLLASRRNGITTISSFDANNTVWLNSLHVPVGNVSTAATTLYEEICTQVDALDISNQEKTPVLTRTLAGLITSQATSANLRRTAISVWNGIQSTAEHSRQWRRYRNDAQIWYQEMGLTLRVVDLRVPGLLFRIDEEGKTVRRVTSWEMQRADPKEARSPGFMPNVDPNELFQEIKKRRNS